MFEPETLVATSLQMASDIKCADLDGDGDLDILASAESPSVLLTFENYGNNIFGEPVLVDRTVHDISDIYLEDMNGDGLLDIIYAGQRLRYRHNLGNLQFSADTILDYDIFNKLEAADIDGDGDRDIVACSSSNDLIKWYANDGFGNFGTANSLAQFSSFADPVWFSIEDIDTDGDLDVVSALHGHNEIALSLNNGLGVFALPQTILSNFNGAASVELADFDGDNDLDFVATSSQLDQVVWSENLGSLTFGSAQIIASSFNNPQCVFVQDVDGDSDIDIVAGSLSVDPLVIANLGGGSFASGQSLGTENIGVRNLVVVDVNNDSNPEVLIASSFNGSFSFYENLGGLSFSPRQLISKAPVTLKETILSDLDQDGYLDIVSGSTNGKLSWNRNRGNVGFGPIQLISGSMDNPKSIVSTDIDGDGDPDLVIASDTDDKIILFENQGGGQFNSGTIISQFTDGPSDVGVGDIDGDGDLDILNASENDDAIYWYENLGGSFSSEQFIKYNTSNPPKLVDTSDIDNDGDLDVLTMEGAYILWRENGNNWNEHWVAVVTSGNSFSAGDIDLDGDIDVAYAKGGGGNGIGWAENNGSGVFTSHNLETTIGCNSIELFDVDLDGDLDMVYTFIYDQYPVYWRENYGDGIYSAAKQIASEFEAGATTTYTGDVDNDGDIDVVSCEGPRDKIAYFRNKFYSLFQARGNFYVDVNNNGVRDTLEPNFGIPNIESSPGNLWSVANTVGRYVVTFDSTVQAAYNVFPTDYQYWSISSDSASYSVNIHPNFTYVDSLDFGFYPDTLIDSILVDVTAGFPRCNTEVNLWLTSNNEGTTRPTGMYLLEIDTATTFITSSIPPDSIIGNLIYWHYDSLMYFTTDQINLQLAYPNFQYAGDTIEHIFTNNVLDSLNNIVYVESDTVSHVLVCAYDPNDKIADPVGLGPDGYISHQTDFVDYTVRFQNTGNDTAFVVIITDQLDASLDWNSLNMISSSHTVNAEIDSFGLIVFEFAPIYLPDSTTDFAGSQGFVKYRINLNSALPLGTIINNTANIYFDSNPAIITNTTVNTLYDCLLSYDEFPAIIETCEGYSVDYSGNLPGDELDWEIPNVANGAGNTLQWLADTVGQFSMNVHIDNQFCSLDSIFPVIVNPSFYLELDSIEICEGENVQIFGVAQSTAGTYLDSLTTLNGCDSILSISLFVKPTHLIQVDSIEICEGESVQIFGVSQSTTGTYLDSLTTVNGCDSILSVSLIVKPTDFVQLDSIEICEGESVQIFGVNQSIADTYHDTLIASNGCDSVLSIVLSVDPCNGFESLVNMNEILVSPNPASSILNVESPLKIESYRIYDAIGKEVGVRLIQRDSFSLRLYINDLNRGVYTLEVKGDNGEIGRRKFVKSI